MTNWVARLVYGPDGRLPWSSDKASGWEEADWQKIGVLPVSPAGGRMQFNPDDQNGFRFIKLRSRGADVEIDHWTLEFDDGSVLDLSVNCLLSGTESRPMAVARRRLRRITVKYAALQSTGRARLEVWAQPWV